MTRNSPRFNQHVGVFFPFGTINMYNKQLFGGYCGGSGVAAINSFSITIFVTLI